MWILAGEGLLTAYFSPWRCCVRVVDSRITLLQSQGSGDFINWNTKSYVPLLQVYTSFDRLFRSIPIPSYPSIIHIETQGPFAVGIYTIDLKVVTGCWFGSVLLSIICSRPPPWISDTLAMITTMWEIRKGVAHHAESLRNYCKLTY